MDFHTRDAFVKDCSSMNLIKSLKFSNVYGKNKMTSQSCAQFSFPLILCLFILVLCKVSIHTAKSIDQKYTDFGPHTNRTCFVVHSTKGNQEICYSSSYIKNWSFELTFKFAKRRSSHKIIQRTHYFQYQAWRLWAVETLAMMKTIAKGQHITDRSSLTKMCFFFISRRHENVVKILLKFVAWNNINHKSTKELK